MTCGNTPGQKKGRFPSGPNSILFVGLHAFHHVDFFQLPVHHQTHQKGKERCQQGGINITQEVNIPAEHHHVHLRRPDDKGVEKDAKHKTKQYAQQGQDGRLTINIG